MNPETLPQLTKDTRLKKVIIGLALLFIIFLVAFLLRPKAELEQYRLVNANLVAEKNFGYLDGTEVYTYNGMMFYKIDTDNPDSVTVLHSGTKLPEPKDIYWAKSKGALLTFESSFLLSDVQNELQSRGQDVNEATQNYTWYLDFTDGSLRPVNELSILDGSAVYSEEDEGFYYMPDYSSFVDLEYDHSLVPGNTISVHFYDPATGEDTALAQDLGITDTGNLTTCPGYKVCFIARDQEDTVSERLYAINDENKLTEVLNSEGRLFTTNATDRFITVPATDRPSQEGRERRDDDLVRVEESVDFDEEPAYLHTLGSDEEPVDLGFTVGNSEIFVHFVNPGEFYVLDNLLNRQTDDEQETQTYLAGTLDPGFANPKTREVPMEYTGGDAFAGGIITGWHGSSGLALLTDFSGNQVLFTSREKPQELLPVNQQEAEAAVSQCVQDTSARVSEYYEENRLFRVFFTADNDFSRSIKSFSDCMVSDEHASTIAAYNFYFGGLDPVNGRIVTD